MRLNEAKLRILGVDPGLARTGWGLLSASGHQARVLDSGVISSTSAVAFSDRLVRIYDQLRDIILKYKPDVVAVEDVIYVENIRVALKLGHARGVILLLAAQQRLPVVGYAPKEIKESLTGNGNASKLQMQRMVQSILALKDMPSPHDVADAIAVALCHFHRCTLESRLQA